jgi:hypothetical protein
MKNLQLFLIVLFLFCGCASNAPQSTDLRHERDESQLLTKEEFMDRATQTATSIYEGFSAINAGVELYAKDHDGLLPQGANTIVKEMLLENGYLMGWPIVPAFAFTDQDKRFDFVYLNNRQDMDGIGAWDDVICLRKLKMEVCEEFSRLYSSFAPDVMVYDFEEANERYPGEAIGRETKIFAVIWSKTDYPDICGIEWVMKYND